MEVALLWVVADLFCEEVERVCVVAEGLDVVVDPDEGLETVADGLDEVELDDLTAEPPERVEVEPEDLVDVEPEDLVDVEPEDLVDAELDDEREELDLEEDEDPVEPLCEVVVVDLRV